MLTLSLSLSHVILGRPLAPSWRLRLPRKQALPGNGRLRQQDVQVSESTSEFVQSDQSEHQTCVCVCVCEQVGEGEAADGGGEDEESLLRVQTGAGCLTGQ